MSKKYSDLFVQLCNTVLVTSDIPVQRLADFFGMGRTSLRDRISTTVKCIDLNNEDNELLADLVSDIICQYFDEENAVFVPSNGTLEDLYSIEMDNTTLMTLESEYNSNEEDTDSMALKKYSEMQASDRLDNESLAEYAARLSRQKQRAQDIARTERAVFRNENRALNVIEELNIELLKLLESRKKVISKTKPLIPSNNSKSSKVGVIQLSDLHFGELVKETLSNRYDLDIAARRLRKLVERAKVIFKADNIQDVAVMLTGDMINSTRRISEITTYADARVKVVFNAYLILGEVLEDLASEFNITVSSVVGNESRLSEFFDTTNYLVSDNFDFLLHKMLARTHERKGLAFVFDEKNPMEQVVDVNGVNFLLVHGNGHRGLAHTQKIESEVEKIKARYSSHGVQIQYVICGHIHSTYMANNYARSASLVGSNSYSERNLNFTSKASQNLFVVDTDGTIDGIMVDLQAYDGYEPYGYDKDTVMYTNDNEPTSGTVLIQKVILS